MKKLVAFVGGGPPRLSERANAEYDIVMVDELRDSDCERVTGAIATAFKGISNETLDRLPNLEIISTFGVGYDLVDVDYTKERGILLTHTPSVLDDDVANTAVMLLLGLSRNMVAFHNYTVAGRWESEGNVPLTHGIRNKVVGFFGMGRIGQDIARKLEAFGPKIAYHSRNPRSELSYDYHPSLSELARASEYLIVIAPGNEATFHAINSDILADLGSGGSLINVGRGSIVDENALIAALEVGVIKAAALDVFEHEPRVPEKLRQLPNVILQPHIASATVETRNAMADLTIDNLNSYFENGKAITVVPEMAGDFA